MKNKILAAILTPFLIVSSLFLSAVPANAADLATIQNQIVSETNSYRVANGLQPLTVNADLTTVAMNWSHQQSTNGQMSHNPNVTSQIPAGWYAWGENVGTDYDYTEVTTAWMNSPGHRANILSDNYTEIGIGYWEENGRNYYTQVYATYKPLPTPPTQPTGVRAVSKTTSSLTFTWNPSGYDGGTPITGYVARVIDSVTGSEATTNVTGTTATLSNLRPGRVYAMSVKAVNARGTSSFTNPVNAQTTPVAPDAPTLQSQRFGVGTASLTFTTWEGGAYAHTWTYQLEGREPVKANMSTVTFTELLPKTVYKGTVIATNDYGSSVASPFQFTTPVTAPAPPAAPALTFNNDQLTVGWRAPANNGGSPVTSYTVNLFKADKTLVGTVNTTDVSTKFSNLIPGGKYYATITATNSIGQSTAATSANFMVPALLPSEVQNVAATLDDERKITVVWTAPANNGGADILNYNVQVFVNGGTTPVDTFSVAPNLTQRVFTSSYVKSATSYRFAVTATNSTGASNPVSTEPVDVPKEITLPSTPQNVTVKDVTSDKLTVTWAEPTDNGGAAVTGYIVKVTGAGKENVANVSAGTLTSSFTGLTRGAAYTISVQAVNKVGSSDASTATATMKLEAPSTVRGIQLTLTAPTTGTATWLAPMDDGGTAITQYSYTLYMNDTQVKTGKTTDTKLVFSGLGFGSQYRLEVTATNGQFTSSVATSNTVTTSTPPGLAENVTAFATAGTVDVAWSAPADAGTRPVQSYSATLFDSAGKAVATKSVPASTTVISFADLKPNATYYATVATFSNVTSGKVVTSNTVTTPVVAPSTPRSVKAWLTSNSAAKLSWLAPTSNGGTAVTGYTVQMFSDNELVSEKKTSNLYASFTGLKPNIRYTFYVTAQHALSSDPSTVVEVTTNPVVSSAPLSVKTINSGDRTLKTTWLAPTNTGGTPIIQYVVTYLSADGLVAATQNVDGNTLTATVTGLTRGVKYTTQVKAVNIAGSSAAGNAAAVTVSVAKPAAPTNPSIKAEDSSTISVSWVAPLDNGGSSITSYKVNLTDSSGKVLSTATVSSTSSNAIFINLKPATSYKATVVAVNGAGASLGSTTPEVTTPAAAPSAPRSVTAKPTSANTAIVVAWQTPSTNNGAAVVSYKVVITDGTTNATVRTVTTSSLSTTITGLARNRTYNVAVTATNSAGTSPSVLVSKVYLSSVIPTAVQEITVDVNSVTATVKWKYPKDNGGSGVKNYTVTLKKGSTVVSTVTTTRMDTVLKGLNPMTSYVVTVAANNAVGTSPAAGKSFKSGAVAPDKPTNVKATVSGDSVTATWTAPAYNGGSTVTSYTASLVDKSTNITVKSVKVTGTTVKYTGVLRGKTYMVYVKATNVIGSSGATSTTRFYVSPAKPSTPTKVVASVSSATVKGSWVAPANNGAPITSYTAKLLNADTKKVLRTSTVTGTTVQFTNVTRGVKYIISVTATNKAGTSLAGTSGSVVVEAVAPTASQKVTASVSNTTVNSSWAASSHNGSPILSYTVKLVDSSTKKILKTVKVTGTTTKFTGVPRGSKYHLVVTATNKIGTSKATTSNTVYVAPLTR